MRRPNYTQGFISAMLLIFLISLVSDIYEWHQKSVSDAVRKARDETFALTEKMEEKVLYDGIIKAQENCGYRISACYQGHCVNAQISCTPGGA